MTTHIARLLRYIEVPILIAVPVLLGFFAFFRIDQAALLTVVVALVAVAVFFAGFELSRPALRQIMPTVVLAALAAAGRILFFAVPNFKPVSAICVVAGVVFGRRCGFMTGALAALVSNFFFGQGAWTPWQMYAWGMIGYLAGVLADHGVFEYGTSRRVPACANQEVLQGAQRRFRPRRLAIYIYAAIASLFYGFLLSTWTLVGYIYPLTWETALLTYGAGVTFDVSHVVSTVVFLLIIYEPWRTKLERIKEKYALAGG